LSIEARTPPILEITGAIQRERNAKLATSGRSGRKRGCMRKNAWINMAPS
jgi:hypothetical protein